MSHWKALIGGKPFQQREHWPEPVKTNGRALNARPPQPPKGTVRPLHPSQLASPMAALCECGARYGMHRVKDYLCPNPAWRPGNGEPQWMEQVFQRGTAASQER